ncbi:hypothetical protein C5B90_01650 [Haloferax sp. Atlit-12N]|nr:hypothetical protein C5B90_01650 [Haloferax sp. Atlit-12N]
MGLRRQRYTMRYGSGEYELVFRRLPETNTIAGRTYLELDWAKDTASYPGSFESPEPYEYCYEGDAVNAEDLVSTYLTECLGGLVINIDSTRSYPVLDGEQFVESAWETDNLDEHARFSQVRFADAIERGLREIAGPMRTDVSETVLTEIFDRTEPIERLREALGFSGAPDLVGIDQQLFGGPVLVEVKAHTDQFQDTQEHWMGTFRNLFTDVYVCEVRPA